MFLLCFSCIAALWSPVGNGLTSWLLLVMFIVFLLLSHVVSWVRCGTLIVSFPVSLPSFLLYLSLAGPTIPQLVTFVSFDCLWCNVYAH